MNLTASVTHVVELTDAHHDSRFDATKQLARLDPVTLTESVHPAGPEPDTGTVGSTDVPGLRRGEVVDLPDGIDRWEALVTWPADRDGRAAELDVVAFVTDGAERVLSDGHFTFFNNLGTPAGEVELTVDTAGEARIVLQLDEVADDAQRIVLAATTTGGQTFGDVGPVELLLTDAGGTSFARGVCDAATTEQSLLIAEVYRRGERWRIRSIGQGYDDGLPELAVRYGVDVA